MKQRKNDGNPEYFKIPADLLFFVMESMERAASAAPPSGHDWAMLLHACESLNHVLGCDPENAVVLRRVLAPPKKRKVSKKSAGEKK